jgi:DNA-binding XRE family transcriptional regulator
MRTLKLREIREKQALSQRTLAALAGVRPATVNYAETGKHRPSPLTRRKLAAALRTPVGRIDFEVPHWVWNIPPRE